MSRLLIGTLFTAALYGQPAIFYRGIVNSASYEAPGLPAGAIAQGSTFAIFGTRLGPATFPKLAFPLQNSLGGVSVTITQGSKTVNAIPVFVSAGRVNAIMPSNAPLGTASLQIVSSNFGIYAANSAGDGPGIIQNFVSGDQQPVNALSIAAKPGQTEILWGTGLGPASFPDNVAPTVVSLATKTEVSDGTRAYVTHYLDIQPALLVIDVPNRKLLSTIPLPAAYPPFSD